MVTRRKASGTVSPEPLPPSNLRSHTWTRFLRGPDPELLDALYVPALGDAVRYDRCCAYFSSSVLAAAARGFGRFIQRLVEMEAAAPLPAVRLVINEEMAADDVRALTETGDTTTLEAQLQRRLKTPTDLLEKRRLAMLGWLVKQGLLDVRIGVMRHGTGIVHGKFGIITDGAGEAVVFNGSGNETAQGLLANYERVEVSTSWDDPERHRVYADEFQTLWDDAHPDVHTVTLPEALRLRLIKFAPKEAPVTEPSASLSRQRAAMLWQYIVETPYLAEGGAASDATAPVDLWPHQRSVVEETAAAWPDGRLLCDEVGMGKTIEAILILRRLLAGRGVRRVLILLPAGLLRQWQAELREKGGLIFPRFENNSLIWPDERTDKVASLAGALQQDVLLLSRETARTDNNLAVLLAAERWDLVLLDEAHAARRREQIEGEFNGATLLLGLLRELQLRRKARGILLLSATPMQTHPWEPWDLLQTLGEGGAWLSDFAGIRNYYAAMAAVRAGNCTTDLARKAAALVVADLGFPRFSDEDPVGPTVGGVATRLVYALPGQRDGAVRWLRAGSPLTRRVHRNTRTTLRQYYARGLLNQPPPRRVVEDMLFDYDDQDERSLYESITKYINRRFEELEHERPGKGFVMTIYRRRASSSPRALQQSLKRRRDGLLRVATHAAYDDRLDLGDAPEALDPDELPEGDGPGRISAALPQSPAAARAEMAEVDQLLHRLDVLNGRDTKREEFYAALRRLTDDGRSALVFTEYWDTLDYLRDTLTIHYGKAVGCYSGAGGQVWDGQTWNNVTKSDITRALNAGELRVLICTDAASEGLNLQAAGALINYDLPWNPSRVEQRIGRVDRIGQKLPVVNVVNLFLKDSIDDQVYRVLKQRCGLFEHFVGAMQPVLARARSMLLGQETVNPDALANDAKELAADPLAVETYVESNALDTGSQPPILTRLQVEQALREFGEESGIRVRVIQGGEAFEVSGTGAGKAVVSARTGALEHDRAMLALTPSSPVLRRLSDRLARTGERLPLVIATAQSGAFRRSVVRWADGVGTSRVLSFTDLTARLQVWDGGLPTPQQWHHAEEEARTEAVSEVKAMEQLAASGEEAATARQVHAARLRLQRELGRFLACLGEGVGNPNEVFYRQMTRDTASSQRLRQCLDRLGGYPEWPPELCEELDAFARQLPENQRRARLLGRELEAALLDPRWRAASSA